MDGVRADMGSAPFWPEAALVDKTEGMGPDWIMGVCSAANLCEHERFRSLCFRYGAAASGRWA